MLGLSSSTLTEMGVLWWDNAGNGHQGWRLDTCIWLYAEIIRLLAILLNRCPNCGNDFQVFKSSLNDDLQLCPFCGQPFSVLIVASCLLFFTVCSLGYFISVLICIWYVHIGYN
ncbi:hypothetical protein V8G54_027589 [Vigna mungo]|uniref:Uncharacterized protein n=1 Tax=Vigna mungo TaxID=3915 RepID=A0AAQ3N2Y3_VIGMU